MLYRYLLALVIQLCWVALGLAHEDQTIVCLPPAKKRYDAAEANNRQTIPWVTNAPDYFQGYGGKAIGAKDATTTYGINCLSDKLACHRFTPDLTVIYGPNTYDMVANGYKFDFTSGCTLIGSPTPTRASCTETKSSHENHLIDSAMVLVPATGGDSTLIIYPATLIVTDTGDFPVPTSTTQVKTSSNPTAMTTGAQIYFGNGTSPVGKNVSTVTVTVLATSVPCHCECDCRQNQTAQATVTVPLAMRNYAVKKAAPVALIGFMAGTMFWI